MLKRNSLFLLILCLMTSPGKSQDKQVLSENDFLLFVRNHHPISLQADIQLEKAEQKLRASRGNFDPVLFSNLDKKEFDNKQYYDLFDGGLKLPTWFGVNVEGGYERNSGVFLNPENEVPEDGLYYAGISIPLGQGLFIDERRATLRQAQLIKEASEFERQEMLNQLYLSAIISYWNWTFSYASLSTYKESLQLAKQRFEAVKKNYLLGDKPAIDTVEAFLQVQNIESAYWDAANKLENARLKLSTFLWGEGQIPLEIGKTIIPEELKYDSVNDLDLKTRANEILKSIEAKHPQLLLIQNSLSSLEIQRRLKAEKIKPKVDIKYNVLYELGGSGEFSIDDQLNDKYKLGVKVVFPLFIRNARGEYSLYKLKIEETTLKLAQKELELVNKINMAFNNYDNSLNQITLKLAIVENYQRMLNGEYRKFSFGESSLFIINTREHKYIKSRIELLKQIASMQIAQAQLKFTCGFLWNDVNQINP